MGTRLNLNTFLDHLGGVDVPDDLAGEDALEAMRALVVLRNVVDHLAVETVLDIAARGGVRLVTPMFTTTAGTLSWAWTNTPG
ncbi:hypothetical protein MAUB1S_00551 [Mycolicibacterium aubagnense]